MLIRWNQTASDGETDFISNLGPAGSSGFSFYNHDNSKLETQLMWIKGGGNFSIGTTDAKGRRLAVNGSIIAIKVVVKKYANWQDYLFRSFYHLPPLTDVESYINKNGHLPDIPSASEVNMQGINLGEMNKDSG